MNKYSDIGSREMSCFAGVKYILFSPEATIYRNQLRQMILLIVGVTLLALSHDARPCVVKPVVDIREVDQMLLRVEQKKIKETFGIDVIYNAEDITRVLGKEGYYSSSFIFCHTTTSAEKIMKTMQMIHKTLALYPANIQSKISSLSICAVQDLAVVGEDAGGVALDKTVVLSVNQLDEGLHHELAHLLVVHLTEQSVLQQWIQLNKAAYTQHWWNNHRQQGGPRPKGFQSAYAQNTVHEDIACIAEIVFGFNSRDLIDNCYHDQVLKNKVEMLTGCYVNPFLGQSFVKNIPKEEYMQRFGTQGYEFYMKWSEGKMDATYWNDTIVRSRGLIPRSVDNKEKE